MNKISPKVLVLAVVGSLLVGGFFGFFLGIAVTKLGRTFIHNILHGEERADVSHPTKLDRETFQLQYPSNWTIDVTDENHDPDHRFTLHSPGTAFVMFFLGR